MLYETPTCIYNKDTDCAGLRQVSWAYCMTQFSCACKKNEILFSPWRHFITATSVSQDNHGRFGNCCATCTLHSQLQVNWKQQTKSDRPAFCWVFPLESWAWTNSTKFHKIREFCTIMITSKLNWLKGELHPIQKLACFALYFKTIDTYCAKSCMHLKANCPRDSKMALEF